MSRCLIGLFLLAVTGVYAVTPESLLPAKFGNYTRTAAAPAAPAEPEIWKEFGFRNGAEGTYSGPSGSFSVSVFSFDDPTGAFAAWQAEAESSPKRRNSAYSGNFLLRANPQAAPSPEVLGQLGDALPGRITSPLPPLYGHLPEKGRVADSERYLLGPAALARFEPRVPRDVASFERGAEGQVARYRIGDAEVQLTIFSYPTPQIAIERHRQFEQLPGAVVKRSGTMIAVLPESKENPAAARLLEDINYSPSLMWNEFAPKHTTQDAAKMIIAISVLATGLVVASLVLGLFFGGGKILARKLGMRTGEEEFTSLRLS